MLKLSNIKKNFKISMDSPIFRMLLCALFILIFIFSLYIFNSNYKVVNTSGGDIVQKVKILEIVSEDIEMFKGVHTGIQDLKVEVISGEHKGKISETRNFLSYTYSVYCTPGMTVIAHVSEADGALFTDIMSYDREWMIYIIILFFCVIMCVIGGMRGLKSLAALGFTLSCVFFLFVPMLYWGYSPYISVIFISIITTCVTLFFITGYSQKTLASILGTVIGVISAGVFYAIFSALVKVNGYNSPDIDDMIVVAQYQGMDAGGLLFAGILIASLGAVMDVSMSIASTIYEIYTVDRTTSMRKLFKSGINVGRDMMGTMVNTLVLAFTGSALAFLIRIYSAQTSYLSIINFNSISLEIIQSLAGSIGIVLTVPFVSIVSAFLYTKYPEKLRNK